jgi:hypothetical protein
VAGISRYTRPVYVFLAVLFVIGVAVQFFLAGLGLLGGETMQAHNDFGWAALHLFPILMLLIGLTARLPRLLLGMTFVLAVVVFVQPLWVTEFRGEVLGALHVLGALVIFAISRDLAERGVRLLRTRWQAGGQPERG